MYFYRGEHFKSLLVPDRGIPQPIDPSSLGRCDFRFSWFFVALHQAKSGGFLAHITHKIVLFSHFRVPLNRFAPFGLHPPTLVFVRFAAPGPFYGAFFFFHFGVRNRDSRFIPPTPFCRPILQSIGQTFFSIRPFPTLSPLVILLRSERRT